MAPHTGGAVTTAAEAFLDRIIDYAGLFPPARLPLAEAIQRYSGYRKSSDRWLLGRFILPIDRLDALSEHASLFSRDDPLTVSVLGTGGDHDALFLEHLHEDLESMAVFESSHLSVRIESMEVRFPTRGDDRSWWGAFVPAVQTTLSEHNRGDLRLFFEVPWQKDDGALLRSAVEAIAAATGRTESLGLKLRTGGVEASMFPPSERVAAFIDECRGAGVPFKATAGLHHPIRRYDESVQTEMHGFLNVFGAAMLAFVHDLPAEMLAEIIMDDDPSSFALTEDTFRWNDLVLEPDQIRRARAFALSFGSCSFDEPRDDLRHLGIL